MPHPALAAAKNGSFFCAESKSISRQVPSGSI
jgi:hypothetical protein